jgi:hypothetical protein
MSYIIHLQSDAKEFVHLSLAPLQGNVDIGHFDVQVHLSADGRSAQSIMARYPHDYGFSHLSYFAMLNHHVDSESLIQSIESFLPHINFEQVKLANRSVQRGQASHAGVAFQARMPVSDSDFFTKEGEQRFYQMCRALDVVPEDLQAFLDQEEPSFILPDNDRYAFTISSQKLSFAIFDQNLHLAELWKNYNDHTKNNALVKLQAALIKYLRNNGNLTESLALLFGVLYDKFDMNRVMQEDANLMKYLFERICMLLIAHKAVERVDSKKDTNFFKCLVDILPGPFDGSIDYIKAMNARLFTIFWFGLRNYHLKLGEYFSRFKSAAVHEAIIEPVDSYEADIQKAIALSLMENQPVDDEEEDESVFQKALEMSRQGAASEQDLDPDYLLALELSKHF